MEPTLSPRDRIRRGRRPKYKDVTLPEIGRLRLSELSQTELEALSDSLQSEAKAEVRLEDGKKAYSRDEVARLIEQSTNGKHITRGVVQRMIAWSMVNDDGTKVYPDVDDGVREIGTLARADVEALFEAFDELNAFTPGAREKLGKPSGMTGDSTA